MVFNGLPALVFYEMPLCDSTVHGITWPSCLHVHCALGFSGLESRADID